MGMMPLVEEAEIDIERVRSNALENIEKASEYEKQRFDKNKAKIIRHNVGDHVLLKSEERLQTKLDPTFYKKSFTCDYRKA